MHCITCVSQVSTTLQTSSVLCPASPSQQATMESERYQGAQAPYPALHLVSRGPGPLPCPALHLVSKGAGPLPCPALHFITHRRTSQDIAGHRRTSHCSAMHVCNGRRSITASSALCPASPCQQAEFEYERCGQFIWHFIHVMSTYME